MLFHEALSEFGSDVSVGSDQDNSPSRTLSRGLAILQVVGLNEGEPMSLTRITRMSGMPKTTVHRLLGVLREAGMLQRDARGRYLPGPLLLAMGTNYLRKTELREAARMSLMELHNQTRGAVHLGVAQVPWVLNIARVGGVESVSVLDYVGARNALHTTAIGKCLLAFGDASMVDRVILAGLHPRTEKSIRTADDLRAELEKVFERGYAQDDGENEPGVRCVAAPILDHTRHAVASISVSAPESSLSAQMITRWADEVKSAAWTISRRLGWQGIAHGFLGAQPSGMTKPTESAS